LREVFSVGLTQATLTRVTDQLGTELREPLEIAVKDDEKRKQHVKYWFVKCSNKLYECKSSHQYKTRL
jgi:hypothetical protein